MASMYRFLKISVFLSFALLNFGCASYTGTIKQAYTPLNEKAYLYGRFTKTGLPNFGLVLEGMDAEKEYTLKFQNEKSISVIEIDPGKYKITHFIAVSALGEVTGRQDLKGLPYDVSISLAPGNAYYLGDFKAKYSFNANHMIWQITEYRADFNSATEELESKYTNFRNTLKLRAFEY